MVLGPTTGKNYSGEQKVNFESPVPFSKCLRAKIYSNMNVYFDPQGCQTLLLKESDPLLFSLGSWTTLEINIRKYLAKFTSLATVFQSYQEDGWVIMKGCVQQNPVYDTKNLGLGWGSNQGLLAQ